MKGGEEQGDDAGPDQAVPGWSPGPVGDCGARLLVETAEVEEAGGEVGRADPDDLPVRVDVLTPAAR